jgi:ABC-type sugar transport system permease subunit
LVRRDPPPPPSYPMRSQTSIGLSVKIVLLGVLDAVVVWAGVGLATEAAYALLSLLLLGAVGLNIAVLVRRAYPLRYLLPGLLVLFGMVVYPILYNVYISFTNLQTGNLLQKSQVIHLLENRYVSAPDETTYAYQAYVDEKDQLLLLLTGEQGAHFLSAGKTIEPIPAGDPRLVSRDGTVALDVPGYHPVTGPALYQLLPKLEALTISAEGVYLRLSGIRQFKTAIKQYRYDAQSDRLIDLQTGVAYTPVDGRFTAPDGKAIEPGFQTWVGLRNFVRIFSTAAIGKDFARVFLWTIVWATLSVFLSFSLGLSFALLLNDRTLRLRLVYRTLLLVPYVMPVFISAFVWRGMFNENFGIFNRILGDLFNLQIPWLTNAMWARASLIIINVWLTFPYMMLISLGALQSIPDQLYEAARVDGAGAWRRFRTVTLPLLMISLAPLLIGAFAFAFNNFTLIYLVTAGRPAVLGAATPAGATDILISWTYRISFQGGTGNNYGLAAAISILIFIMIATISAIGFRMSRHLEEVYS